MRLSAAVMALVVALFIAQGTFAQSSGSTDIKAFQRSCYVTKRTLSVRAQAGNDRSDDEFAAAGRACDRLNQAIASSDNHQIEAAETELRPLFAQLGMPPSTPAEQFAALEKAASGKSGEDLFYQLPHLAWRALEAGNLQKAQAYSQQSLEMAAQYPKDWNYGNAIYTGNLVLGRLALQRGDVKKAGEYLLLAGATPGSPQLDSFGPNMTLAKELLEKGQKDQVLKFFALCRRFWKSDFGKLDGWTADVQNGKIPSFEANLKY